MITDEQRAKVLRLRRLGVRQNLIAKIAGVGKTTITTVNRDLVRVVVLADLHCGHRAGLTAPAWQWQIDNNYQKQFAIQQKEMFDWFTGAVEELQPIDRLIVNGDALDGKGKRSGGTELIRASRDEQVEMAYDCISLCHAPKILLTRGTPYHTGVEEDWENLLAKELRANALVEVSDHAYPIINGIQFSIKHHQASSSVPHGRMTPLAKAKLWNQVWMADKNQQPDVKIIIRSHTHYFDYCGNHQWMAVSTPALQGWGSKYGQKRCEGKIDFGLIWFDIPKGSTSLGDVKFGWNVAELESQKVKVSDW